jgi:hypothetical protein
MYKIRFWKGARLSIGGSGGATWRGGGLLETERQVTISRASPLGSRRDVYKQGLETGVYLYRGPVGGTCERESFTGNIKGKVRFYFYQETLFTRYM